MPKLSSILFVLYSIGLVLTVWTPLRHNLRHSLLNQALWQSNLSASERSHRFNMASRLTPIKDIQDSPDATNCTILEEMLYFEYGRKTSSINDVLLIENDSREIKLAELSTSLYPITIYSGISINSQGQFVVDWSPPNWTSKDLSLFNLSQSGEGVAHINYNDPTSDRDTLGLTLRPTQLSNAYWKALEFEIKADLGTQIRFGEHFPVEGIKWIYLTVDEESWQTYIVPFDSDSIRLYIQFVEPNSFQNLDIEKIIQLKPPRLLLSDAYGGCS